MSEKPYSTGTGGADSAEIQRLATQRVGSTLAGKWTLVRLIGVGGMASVYEASHRSGAVAAVKLLHAPFARRADLRTRFMREGYIANVAGPGAVRVLDDDVDDDGAPFLVMDLLSGETVQERSERRGGRLHVLEVLWIAEQTLRTLTVAHASGVIHRDLKPANLFVTSDYELKVLDFGIARARSFSDAGEETLAGMILGTLGFMAPEQAGGRPGDLDGRADLWSVGAIMFVLLTDREVHDDSRLSELVVAATKRARSVASVDPTLPASVVEIVDRALQFSREDRYPDARTMRQAILRVAGKAELREAIRAPVAAAPPPPPPTASVPNPAVPVAAAPAPGRASGRSDADTLALRRLFELIELALLSRADLIARGDARSLEASRIGSYRRLELAYEHATQALELAHIGLFWNVLPEGFATRQGLLWTARPPLPPTPPKLYGEGIRMLGVLPGLTLEEFGDIARIIHGDLAPFTDVATLLTSSTLPHVVYRLDATKPGVPDSPAIGLASTMAGQTDLRQLVEMLATEDPAVRGVLMRRLGRVAIGHEGALGALLPTASVGLAERLLQVLASLPSATAKAAVRRARENPSPLVRILALSSGSEGAADDEALRRELAGAFAEADGASRMRLLVAIETHRIAAAAPQLAWRVGSGSFDLLPAEERRQAFSTLSALVPARAETVATALLRDQRVLSTEAHETTRALACELLGRIARSRDARDALVAASNDRSKAREAVWTAAREALIAFDSRTGAVP